MLTWQGDHSHAFVDRCNGLVGISRGISDQSSRGFPATPPALLTAPTAN